MFGLHAICLTSSDCADLVIGELVKVEALWSSVKLSVYLFNSQQDLTGGGVGGVGEEKQDRDETSMCREESGNKEP